MGWQKPSHLSDANLRSLEVELHGQFEYASAILDGCLPEVGIGLCNRSRGRILLELQGQVARVGERIQRMIQEIIGLNPELNLFRLRDA